MRIFDRIKNGLISKPRIGAEASVTRPGFFDPNSVRMPGRGGRLTAQPGPLTMVTMGKHVAASNWTFGNGVASHMIYRRKNLDW